MYLDTRDLDETMDIYTTAWKKGLKSTYYLHMKPRHTAEQSTTKVNKAEKMGKRGFAAVASVKKEDTDSDVHDAILTPLTDLDISTTPIENPKENLVPVSTLKDPELTQEESMAQAVLKQMEILANHPNASSSRPTSAGKGFASVSKAAETPKSAPTHKPAVSAEKVKEMMENFGKKPHNHTHADGPEDPGTANICIGCE
jgi:hypothetical protein